MLLKINIKVYMKILICTVMFHIHKIMAAEPINTSLLVFFASLKCSNAYNIQSVRSAVQITFNAPYKLLFPRVLDSCFILKIKANPNLYIQKGIPDNYNYLKINKLYFYLPF